MLIEVKRKYKKNDYTIGRVYINGKFICNSLEDTDRGLRQSDQDYVIEQKKVYGKTAIPNGNYNVIITYSPKFKKNLPLVENVKGFEGIRIHSGNTPKDTLGCILLGMNTKVGMLTDSRLWTDRVIDEIKKALEKKELVTLKIY